MIILLIILGIVVLFMAACGIGAVIAFRSPELIFCVECSPIGAGARWRRPQPGEVCEVCGAEPAHVEY